MTIVEFETWVVWFAGMPKTYPPPHPYEYWVKLNMKLREEIIHLANEASR